jgi:hypothetical protein
MAREVKANQDYKSKLLKLIPSEIIAAYLVIEGIIPEERKYIGTLVLSIILLVLVPLYLREIYRVRRIGQHIFVILAFVVWVYSLGGPFKYWNIWEAWIGSSLLILYTLCIPLFYKPADNTSW